MNIISINSNTQAKEAVNFNSIATKLSDLAFRCAEEEAEHCSQHFLDTVSKNLYAISDQVAGLLNAPLAMEPLSKKKLVFLACPYTAEHEVEQLINLEISILAARWLMKQGFDVYNPLAHGCQILSGAPEDFRNNYIPYFNWHEMNCRIMAACDAFVWLDRGEVTDKSQGMRAELKEAQRLGLPILGLKEYGGNFVFIREGDRQAHFPVTHIAEGY